MLALVIVGRILLIAVCAAAALILLVLFVPVKYKAEGRANGGLQMKASCTWLFRLVGLTLIVKERKITVRLHIAKFRRVIYRSGAKKKKPKAKIPYDQTEDKDEEKGMLSRIASLGKEFLSEEGNRRLLKKILRKLGKLLKRLSPQKIKTNLNFSLGAPDTTGLATGAISLVPAVYQYDIGLYPDFEADSAYISGTFHVKGKIRLVHVAAVALSLLANRKIRKLIKEIRRSANE